MTSVDPNALRRGQSLRANFWRKATQMFWRTPRAVHAFFFDPRQSLPPLPDHLARDIGLDEADLEWTQLQWPSQQIPPVRGLTGFPMSPRSGMTRHEPNHDPDT